MSSATTLARWLVLTVLAAARSRPPKQCSTNGKRTNHGMKAEAWVTDMDRVSRTRRLVRGVDGPRGSKISTIQVHECSTNGKQRRKNGMKTKDTHAGMGYRHGPSESHPADFNNPSMNLMNAQSERETTKENMDTRQRILMRAWVTHMELVRRTRLVRGVDCPHDGNKSSTFNYDSQQRTGNNDSNTAYKAKDTHAGMGDMDLVIHMRLVRGVDRPGGSKILDHSSMTECSKNGKQTPMRAWVTDIDLYDSHYCSTNVHQRKHNRIKAKHRSGYPCGHGYGSSHILSRPLPEGVAYGTVLVNPASRAAWSAAYKHQQLPEHDKTNNFAITNDTNLHPNFGGTFPATYLDLKDTIRMRHLGALIPFRTAHLHETAKQFLYSGVIFDLIVRGSVYRSRQADKTLCSVDIRNIGRDRSLIRLTWCDLVEPTGLTSILVMACTAYLPTSSAAAATEAFTTFQLDNTAPDNDMLADLLNGHLDHDFSGLQANFTQKWNSFQQLSMLEAAPPLKEPTQQLEVLTAQLESTSRTNTMLLSVVVLYIVVVIAIVRTGFETVMQQTLDSRRRPRVNRPVPVVFYGGSLIQDIASFNIYPSTYLTLHVSAENDL
ncbi:hypothetical protein C8Q74DRAFT_1216088 [Fomes fomentarius]|nr:hypothetical protein C8Q74DRAFT_1216088 [Fomes fomentarius]